MNSTPPPKHSPAPVSVWGLAEVAALCGVLATVTGFLGRWAWLLELTSHFRLQLAMALALLAMAGLVGRRWRLAVGAGAFCGINVALVLWAASPTTSSPVPANAPRLRVLSINVHTANNRTELVLEAVRRTSPDVVLLLEVDYRWMAALVSLRTNYPFVYEDARSDNFGIALFCRELPSRASVVEIGQAGVPSVAAEFNLGGRSLRFLGTHPLPPGSPAYAAGRNEQLREIAKWCREQGCPTTVCGDLNVTPWSPRFADLLRDGNLRLERPDWSMGISWPTGMPWFGIPLDHCLNSPEVSVVRNEILDPLGSDHRPLLVEVALR